MLISVVLLITVVLYTVEGNNFPPVKNPVPIPAPGVKAPVDIPASVYLPIPETVISKGIEVIREPVSLQRPVLDSKFGNQRWISNVQPLVGYPFQSKQPVENLEIFEEPSKKFYSGELPASGPVATPRPDETVELLKGVPLPNTPATYPPEGPVIIPSSDVWISGKGPENQYLIQRWRPVQVPSEKVFEVVNSGKSSTIIGEAVKNTVPPVGKFTLPGPTAVLETAFPELGKNQVWVRNPEVAESPKIYPSLEALIENLPSPKQVKDISVPFPAFPERPGIDAPGVWTLQKDFVSPQIVKDSLVPVAPLVDQKGHIVPSEVVSPKLTVIPSVSKEVPFPIIPKDLPPTIPASNGWIVTSDGLVSQVRYTLIPREYGGYGAMSLNDGYVPVKGIPDIKGVEQGKSVTPVVVPNGVAESWVFRQDGKLPRYERQRTILPYPVVAESSKGVPPTAISVPVVQEGKTPYTVVPVTGKITDPSFTVPISDPWVLRNGNPNPQFSLPVVQFPPHSPKSDVLVIGKGASGPHVVPQKAFASPIPAAGVLPARSTMPFLKQKPCVTTANIAKPVPTLPYPGAPIFVPPQSQNVLASRKIGQNAIQLNRYPFSYRIWNPNVRSNFYVFPQRGAGFQAAPQRVPTFLPVTRPVSGTISVPQSRFSYPLRFIRPYSFTAPSILDLPSPKQPGFLVRAAKPLPSSVQDPKPEKISSSGETSSSEKSTENSSEESSKDKKKEKESSKSKEVSKVESESAEESSGSAQVAETTLIERIEQAPDDFQLQTQGSTYYPPKDGTLVPVPETPDLFNNYPKPYVFGYDQRDGQGTLQHRQETSNADGVVKGSYGYRDSAGVYRKVDYVADEGGFHAVVNTNEPGTVSHGSADVDVVHEPPTVVPDAQNNSIMETEPSSAENSALGSK